MSQFFRQQSLFLLLVLLSRLSDNAHLFAFVFEFVLLVARKDKLNIEQGWKLSNKAIVYIVVENSFNVAES